MTNTTIQIKRSTVTQVPSGGSLIAAEPAYSYLSNTFFFGTSDGNGIIPVGGYSYVLKTNSAYDIAISAFNSANSSNSLNIGAGANAFASATIAGANTAVGAGANAFASATIAGANTAVGTGANTYLRAIIAGANTAVGTGANTYANATFVKLTADSQTITGNLSVTGSLTISGNAFSIDTETLRVSDPLIYLAGNNYVSDIVDIGFVGNYVNATGSNVHTGLFRDATSKTYYLFQGYNKEPVPNHIDPSGNNFTLAVLNADLITSNLSLGGINAISWITSAFDKANAANVLAYNTGLGANAYAAAVGTAANTNAANASYLSTGTVPSAQISGSYTGITGVGTISTGIWNGSVINVAYGGTGTNTFANNGILFGNTTGAIRVTVAGTEGQVLQVTSQGTPAFGMIDGGIF